MRRNFAHRSAEGTDLAHCVHYDIKAVRISREIDEQERALSFDLQKITDKYRSDNTILLTAIPFEIHDLPWVPIWSRVDNVKKMLHVVQIGCSICTMDPVIFSQQSQAITTIHWCWL